MSAWIAALRGLLARPLASYYLLISSAGLLLGIGLTMVFSATSVHAYATDGNAFGAISKQAAFALIGLVGFWVCQRLPARTYRGLALPAMALAFVLVGLVDVLTMMGTEEHPATLGPLKADGLWLYLGPLQVQPSELAKLALVLWGADVLARKGASVASWRELAMPLFPVAGLLFVMVGYHDLGTMLCLLAVLVGLLWVAGVRLRIFAAMAAVALGGIGMLILAAQSEPTEDPAGGAATAASKNYRLARLSSFFHPSANCAQADCYQAVQGRYAIANGGWFGVGLGKASLKWGWLPNGHNDFIFAVIAEELGVIGCLVVLALFAVLTYTGLRIARRVRDPFRRLAAAAVIIWLVGQSVINIGGVVGLLPITGLPLPFISDGGSALVVSLAAVGMLASFARAEPDAARALHARPPAPWVRLVWAPLPPLPAEREPARRPATGPGSARQRAGQPPGRSRPVAAPER